jgi:hypothetical protein
LKTEHPIKHFAFAFVIAVVVYAVAYNFIEHRRTKNGPWIVKFTETAEKEPLVIINQRSLGMENVQLVFAGNKFTNSESTILSFKNPKPVPYSIPFGQCIFMDTTFLPGTLTMNLYGHEIELLPRVLKLDHEERAWRRNERVVFSSK